MTTMPYATWVRRRTCTGKTKWKNEEKARRSAEHWAAFHRESLNAWIWWGCDRCGYWHAGHRSGVDRA